MNPTDLLTQFAVLWGICLAGADGSKFSRMCLYDSKDLSLIFQAWVSEYLAGEKEEDSNDFFQRKMDEFLNPDI